MNESIMLNDSQQAFVVSALQMYHDRAIEHARQDEEGRSAWIMTAAAAQDVLDLINGAEQVWVNR